MDTMLGDLDFHLIAQGRHWNLADRLGAHPAIHEGREGVRFAVWAPNAKSVSVVGDFNGWDVVVTQQLESAAGRENLDALGVQCLGKFQKVGFIRNADECAADFNETAGRACHGSFQLLVGLLC